MQVTRSIVSLLILALVRGLELPGRSLKSEILQIISSAVIRIYFHSSSR